MRQKFGKSDTSSDGVNSQRLAPRQMSPSRAPLLALLLACASAEWAAEHSYPPPPPWQTDDCETDTGMHPDAEAYNMWGARHMKHDRYEAALESYRQATLLEPEHAEGYHGMGKALRKLERPTEAIQPLSVAYQLDPSSGQASPSVDLGAALVEHHDKPRQFGTHWSQAQSVHREAER